MNYIVLNDTEYYKNIQLYRFQEVKKDGRNRVDGIFGTITRELLDQSSEESTGRGHFFGEEWLCRDSGVHFVVIRVPQDILYDDTGKSLERCFGLFDPKSFWLELGSIGIKNKENKYEYFFVAYNKNSLNFNIIFDEKYVELEENDILDYVCQKIEEKIL